ncbi:MAG: hypothetical protein V7719_03755 [Psychroserpens sp.]|uniref:hypothetical protein n=1 Tax=Psychroserpens sp. TaxID=2020870 RepID=UPI00300294FE
MKYFFTICLSLMLVLSYAQENTITIDYTVDYVVPNKRKQTVDTLTVGYTKSGRYIWTDSKSLAKDLGKSIFRRNPELLETADLGIIFDTEEGILMMCFESGKNKLFFNLELSTIIPDTMTLDEDEEFELVSESTGEQITLLDKTATVYDIYPSNKVSEAISVAFDESVSINNNQVFKKIFEVVLASEGSSGMLGLVIPEGLIMRVTENERTLLEACNIDSTTKKIHINYSFKITE